MELTYHYSESTVKPESVWIDITTVYIRKDVQEEQRMTTTIQEVEQEDGSIVPVEVEVPYVMYTYQEAMLSHEEFNAYSKEMMAKNAVTSPDDSRNILNIMAGQEMTDGYQLATMEAVADLYEKQDANEGYQLATMEAIADLYDAIAMLM